MRLVVIRNSLPNLVTSLKLVYEVIPVKAYRELKAYRLSNVSSSIRLASYGYLGRV